MAKVIGSDFNLMKERLIFAAALSTRNGHKVENFKSQDFIIYSGQCASCKGIVQVDLSVYTPEEEAYLETLDSECQTEMSLTSLAEMFLAV